MGAWLGDGCSNAQRDTHYPTLYSVDGDWANSVASILGSPVHVSKREAPLRDIYVVGLGRNGLGLLESHAFKLPMTSRNKYIPFEIFRWGDECLWHLLAGLLDTDGTIPNPHKNAQISFSSSSGTLAKGVGSILKRFGVGYSIYHQKSKDTYIVSVHRVDWLKLEGIPLRLGYKKARLDCLLAWYKDKPKRMPKGD